MAAQTFSTNLNLDAASKLGLLNGEAITIDSGATVTANSDNRWSQQAAVIASSSINAVTGGRLLVDGRDVWQVPFSASTGNVPNIALSVAGVQDCTGQNTFSTGEFLGIWATGELTPRTAGSAMPATGYVKFRSKVGGFDALGEVINLQGGATITTIDAGKRSWIDFVANYQGTFTVPRLGTFEARGDWYDLGTTNGLNNQEFDYPFLGPCNGIWIETFPGSNVYEKYAQAGARWNSGTATISTDARGKYFGQRAATVTGSVTSGSAVVTTTATTELTVGMPINASSGWSNLAMYIVAISPGVSFTVNANSNLTVPAATFVTWRTKIQLASSVAPAVGYLPVTGCKVRCPNLRLSNSVAGWAGNMLPSSQSDRYEFATTAAGQIIMDTVDCGWFNNLSAPYSVEIRRCAITLGIIAANVATTFIMEDCVTSHENGSATTGLSLSNCYGGGQITNCRIARYSAGASGDNACALTDCSDFTFTDCELRLGGTNSTTRTRGNGGVQSLLLTRCFRINLVRTSVITGKVNILGCIDVSILDTRYADLEQGANPGATNSTTGAFDVNSGSANIYGEGFSNYGGIADIHPYNCILSYATGCSNVEWRSVGTPAAPYNGGVTNPLRRAVVAAVTVGLTLRRIYIQNTATDFGSIANTVQGVELIDCWADGADANAFAGVNQTNRGCRWTNSITGQNAVYGNHWEHAWISTIAGRVVIKCNEPTTETAAQCAVTAGTPKFTSTGNVAAPAIGDQVTWECPFFILGPTSMANVVTTITGTNTGNFSLEFQYDLGAGYNGSWIALSGANLSAIGAINPAVGIRFKVRATTTVANATNALTYIRFDTVTNSTDQQIAYPLPVLLPVLMISGFATGSDVVIYDADVPADGSGSNVLTTYDAVSGTSVNHIYTYEAGLNVKIGIFKAGYVPLIVGPLTLGENDSTLPVSQQADRNYAA